MKFGFVLPYGDARVVAELAKQAEETGWDGFFVWDPVWGIDPWVSLAAAAMVTDRIRLGTMITPLSRRRPWKLAGETATLDRLSNGRVILSVGLGALDTGFDAFGEVADRKTRVELLDEGLDILTGLWRGQPFSYEGKHYHIKETAFYPPPPPVQQPRIPIWVVGAWPKEKSIRRALRYDGLLPAKMDANGKFLEVTPEDIRAMKAFIEQNRTEDTKFDIVIEGRTPAGDSKKFAAKLRRWEEAGTTWWIEGLWDEKPEVFRARLAKGPPRPG